MSRIRFVRPINAGLRLEATDHDVTLVIVPIDVRLSLDRGAFVAFAHAIADALAALTVPPTRAERRIKH